MSNPTQRTLKRIKKAGYRAEVVEHFNAFTNRRHDLYGCIDVLGLGDGETIAVQCTSASNLAARVRKITDSDALADMRRANWRVVAHGWRKNAAGRWVCREIDLS